MPARSKKKKKPVKSRETAFDQMTRKRLLDLAKQEGISGTSKLTKADLISVLLKSTPKQAKSPKTKNSQNPRATEYLSTDHTLVGEGVASQAEGGAEALSLNGESMNGSTSNEAQANVEQTEDLGSAQEPYDGQGTQEAEEVGELPDSYNETKIVVMVRDPYWAYTYWDFHSSTYAECERVLREEQGTRAILRIHDVTDVEFNGTNAHTTFDVDVVLTSKNWYLHLGCSNRSFVVDLGLLDAHGNFRMIVRSNVIRTPRDCPSDVIDEAWASSYFDEIYALSGGRGVGASSGEFGKRDFGMEWLSSGAVSSYGFMVEDHRSESGFSLEVNTELIVHGRTQADAHLEVQGKKVLVRPDGTFSLRFTLPNGEQDIPVKATSRDEADTCNVSVSVSKSTQLT